MPVERDIVLEKVRSHLAEELGVDAGGITDDTHFRDDLEADSLDLYELVMELEDTYGVAIPEQDAVDILTVGQAVDYVHTRLPAGG